MKMKRILLSIVFLASTLLHPMGAGGPIYPSSAFPVTSGFVYPGCHVGAGANSKQDCGLQVTDATTLTTDAIWRLRFWMPPTLPSGTCKLRIWALANATSNAMKINPKWASVNAEEDPSGATLQAEGTNTITWAAGDNDQYKELKVTLDADTVVAGEMIVMDLTFEDTSTTLAVVSTYHVAVIWE
jgi:hypothetical protein